MMCEPKRTHGGGSLGNESPSKESEFVKFLKWERIWQIQNIEMENDQVDLGKNEIFSLLYLMVRESYIWWLERVHWS